VLIGVPSWKLLVRFFSAKRYHRPAAMSILYLLRIGRRRVFTFINYISNFTCAKNIEKVSGAAAGFCDKNPALIAPKASRANAG
jgi:hypothetical protein